MPKEVVGANWSGDMKVRPYWRARALMRLVNSVT